MKGMNGIYKKYMASKVGMAKAEESSDFDIYDYFSKACGVAKNLHRDYDLGLALATNGLWMGYIAEKFEFPVLSVKLGRKGSGATWKPLDEINQRSVKGKKIIVFDNDALTGRTLRRTVKEMNKCSPKSMDLLLFYERTPLTARMYKRGKVPKNLPSPIEIYNEIWDKNGSNNLATSWKSTKEGLIINYLKYGQYEETITENWGSWLTMFSCKTNIPKGFENVMTLENDFQPNQGAVEDFEKRVLNDE